MSTPPSRRRRHGARRWAAPAEAAALTRAGRASCAALRGGLLVRGARHLRAGARRRQAALPGAHAPMPATCCSPGIAAPDARRASPTRLMQPANPSPAGASAPSPTGEARYNPMSYHNGSVWPHDNALIAAGLGALRPARAEPARSSRACSTPPQLIDLQPPAGALLRLSRGAAPGPDALSGRLLAAGLGGGRALRRIGCPARRFLRPAGAPDPLHPSRPCRPGWRSWRSPTSAWAMLPSTCSCGAAARMSG